MDVVAIEKMSVAEVINTAIINEKIAADNYNSIGKEYDKLGKAKMAEFFRDQASREEGHYNRLVKFKSNMTDSVNSPEVGEVMRWVTNEAIFPAEKIASMNIDTALKIIEERERIAERFYRISAKAAVDETIADLFIALADEEAHHVYLSQKERFRNEQKGLIEEPAYTDLGYGG